MCFLFAECLLLVPPISYSAGLSLSLSLSPPYGVTILTFVGLSVDRQFVHSVLFDTEIAFSIVACLERSYYAVNNSSHASDGIFVRMAH
jgi:hypothetical protein